MKQSSDVTADLAGRNMNNMNISQRPNDISTFILAYISILLSLGLQSDIHFLVNFPEILDTFQEFLENFGKFPEINRKVHFPTLLQPYLSPVYTKDKNYNDN